MYTGFPYFSWFKVLKVMLKGCEFPGAHTNSAMGESEHLLKLRALLAPKAVPNNRLGWNLPKISTINGY